VCLQAFTSAMLGSLDQEHASIRTSVLPPGPLTLDSLRRIDPRGLLNRTSAYWTDSVRSAKALAWTIVCFPVIPWFFSDISFSMALYWHLFMAVSVPVVLLQRGRWLSALLRSILLILPIFSFGAYRTGQFWALSFATACLWAACCILVRFNNRHNLALVISRDSLLVSSVVQLNNKDGQRLAMASLRIKYISIDRGVEMGVDAGGLYRDWLGRVASEIFDPALGLFVETDDVDGIRYLRLSEATGALAMSAPEVYEHYRFVGRMIAVALRDNSTAVGLSRAAALPSAYGRSRDDRC
jgi:hypothetical protein